MTMHCNISLVDGQELRKKNQITCFLFSLVQFLASSIKFSYKLTDLSMYLSQRSQVILLEQVGLSRNLQDKTVPMSSNQQAYNILPLAELNSFQEMEDTK